MSKMRWLLSVVLLIAGESNVMSEGISSSIEPKIIVDTKNEPVAPGPYEANWKSLEQYTSPEWFRDAKFGIWAHWGAQCQPEDGDWYARHMYVQDHGQYKFHLQHFGHPSEFGFKDVINQWKAEKFDPQKLVKFYKRVGAQYFFAMANHHDNFDNYDSKYQPWNSTKIGPKRDLIGEWAKAAKDNGLPFGVSVHAAHAWSWYETAQGADKTGPKAGVPYDGKLTKADGKGKWWDGLDPQDLYEQNHAPSPKFGESGSIHGRWNWGNGVSQPDRAYCEKFYNRTVDLINKYQPDLIYFDDTALPLWPVSDAGLKITAHMYNASIARNGGQNRAVVFGKVLDDEQQKAIVWDIERGVPAKSLSHAWQTDTCIGGWHYSRSLYDRNGYKSAKTVIHMLADIVSKNGNLLLNIPVRGDGSIDEKEEKVLEGVAAWMDVNKEAIYSTRPWKIFGEGPASDGAPISAQGFNEGKGKPFTNKDIRFTQKGEVIYAIVLGKPDGNVSVASLGTDAKLLDKKIIKVEQIGLHPGEVKWKQAGATLEFSTIAGEPQEEIAAVFKITTH